MSPAARASHTGSAACIVHLVQHSLNEVSACRDKHLIASVSWGLKNAQQGSCMFSMVPTPEDPSLHLHALGEPSPYVRELRLCKTRTHAIQDLSEVLPVCLEAPLLVAVLRDHPSSVMTKHRERLSKHSLSCGSAATVIRSNGSIFLSLSMTWRYSAGPLCLSLLA